MKPDPPASTPPPDPDRSETGDGTVRLTSPSGTVVTVEPDAADPLRAAGWQ